MRKKYLVLAILALCASACAGQAYAASDGPVLTQPRTQLSVDQLTGEELPDFLHMSFLARPDWAREAAPFSGTVSLAAVPLDMNDPQERDVYDGEHLFPAFSVDFIGHEGAIVPRQQGVIHTGSDSNSFWDVIVGTGAVWREPEDGAWSRASFPLHLVDRYIGQVRNCVASFVYEGDATSNVYVQCSQENADLNAEQLSNIRAMVPAEYETARWPDAAAVLADRERLVVGRMPVAPLSDIDGKGRIAAYFDKSIWTDAATTLGAVYIDGTLYRHAPQTRHGPYPYPDEMRLGVYSVTKSMTGALAMFYFAERYGEEIFDEQVTDYVPALADAPAWQGVTFSHALNMASGTPAGEESHLLLEPLVLAESKDAAIENIAALGDWPEAPGELFKYGSTNTFVLSYALQGYVEEMEGEGVDYWDLVHDNVLVPIGVADFDLLRTRDADPAESIPYLAYGAFPTPDNAAKIAVLIANEGEYDGRQILNRNRIREALGRTDWRGYDTPEFWSKRYRHSFWETPVQASLFCRINVPFMLGYGANHVMFLPSGAIVFRFMDEQNMNVAPLVRAVESVKSSCD